MAPDSRALTSAWSNGSLPGWCPDSSTVAFGTHDWIAYHALDFIPSAEREYLLGNNVTYLCATELPDHGIGDTTRHHVYYFRNGTLEDGSAATRAQVFYDQLVEAIREGNQSGAALAAGVMSHYISDVAVFGHVMGASTDWGSETHHSDYEDYVLARTDQVNGTFNIYLGFDGSLAATNASAAALALAYDTTFDAHGAGRNATWMDSNYNWTSPFFRERAGQSLDSAVNAVADAVHSAFMAAGTPIPEFPGGLDLRLTAVAVAVALLGSWRLSRMRQNATTGSAASDAGGPVDAFMGRRWASLPSLRCRLA